jgi:hypothetical protein
MNYRNRLNLFLYIIIIFIIYSLPIISQTIERTLKQGSFETGINYRYFKRDFPEDYGQLKWNNGNLVLRYGITEFLTFSFEGFVGKNSSDAYINRNYYDYRLGLGFGLKILSISDLKIMFGIHYLENLNFDKSKNNHNKLQKSFITALGVQQSVNFSSIELLVFVYPTFVIDKVFDYTPRYHYRGASLNNFGVITGTDFLAFKHFHFIAEILYADYFQPRFGIGYIF